MELGQKIKEARLRAGLSQRQLCGEEITRNMLSQIENGSARPSMSTLQYLASRLEVSVSYFLEEQAVTSPNQQVMEQARAAWTADDPGRAVELLAGYQSSDPVFDRERWFLEALCLMDMAEDALETGKPVYAIQLLEKAGQAGENTDYYTPELERKRLLLMFRGDPEKAGMLAAELPDMTSELLLRAKAALEVDDPAGCGRILDAAAPNADSLWNYLRAEAYFAKKAYAQAAEHYRLAEEGYPRKTARRLEECYRELGDFKQAYFYACKVREQEG